MSHDPLCINYGGCDCWKCVTPCNCGEIADVQEDGRAAELAAFREGQLAERARIGTMLRALAGNFEMNRSDWENGWRSGVMKAALMVDLP
jgi:hypothetical protein